MNQEPGIPAIRYERLAPPLHPEYAAMTFPAYRHLLTLEETVRHLDGEPRRHVQPIAIGAVDDGVPVGLALAEIPAGAGGEPELLSLLVRKSHRGRGIGTELVKEIETRVREAGFEALRAVWMTGRPEIEAFERVLRKREWDEPLPRMLTIRFSIREAQSTPWFGKYSLGDDYEIFPWKELTGAEREELIRSQREAAWIAPDLQPWDFDASGFEPVSSLGVRRNGKVVGWVINHRINDDIVRFTCSYMRKDVSRLGRIVPVYSESIARLAASTSFRECVLTVPLHHRGMASFLTRWCAPFSTFSGETRGSRRLLRANPSGGAS